MDTNAVTWHLEGEAPWMTGCAVVRGSGREAMNELSRFVIDVVAEEPIDPPAALGEAVTLVVHDEAEGVTRNVGLIVTDLVDLGTTREGARARLVLAPAVAMLEQSSTFRIFQGLTAPEIVEQVLGEAGFGGAQIDLRLSASYPLRQHCTQYDETNWSFLARLLAEEGIAWWFDTLDSGPALVLGDSGTSHEGVSPPAGAEGTGVWFLDPGGLVGPRAIRELEVEHALAPTAVHLREYDVRHPDVLIEGKAGEGELEVFEYPARVPTEEAAVARAKVRLEQLRRESHRATGLGDVVRLQPGRVATIEGTGDDAFDRAWIVTWVEHRFERPSKREGAPEVRAAYENRVGLVPHQEATWRPPRPAARPRVAGVETATTTGAGGEEIHVDDLGSVKLRFPWDRSGILDDGSSTWMRTLQMNMGGSMLLPRVGWEVPVAYDDGDPDVPIVLGRTYNAQGVVPYGLPGRQAAGTFQSATSPADGTTNEIRLSDDAGSMELFVHATRDETIVVGGPQSTTITASEQLDVGVSSTIQIDGSATATVGADQVIDVGTDETTVIDGSRTVMIGGLEHVKVTGNRTMGADGGYVEIVGALYGLQANQGNVDVKGAFTKLVGGSEAQAAGLGGGETVAGARAISVGAARIQVASQDHGEQVIGGKTITAGASSVKADGTHNTKSAGAGSVESASLKVQASSTLTFDAPNITIDVGGNLDAPGFTLGGGKIKIKKGTTKKDGTVTRKGTTKVAK